MQYRRFGNTGFMASALGFGCMRLPHLGEPAQINEPLAIEMIRYAIDHGVNYLDTAWGYHGRNSERLVAKVLKDGYREKVKLATKMPTSEVKLASDFDRLLDEQLGKLQVDQIDFYLLHGLRRTSWDFVRDLGVIKWAEGAMRDGRIGRLGFSFHDAHDAFKHVVDGYDNWVLAQVQYNFLDENYQAGTEGIRYASEKGLAVVVMEPLLGGRLANPPAPVEAIYDRAPVRRTPADWALQWVWSQPEVSVVLSGMSAMAQVRENVESAERSGVGSLSAADLAVVAEAREAYGAAFPIPCTACRYCMPCPNGVDIPLNLHMLNRGVGYEPFARIRQRYQSWDANVLAGSCIECRVCEDKCPQGIPIGDWMPYIHQVLSGQVDYDPAQAPQSRRG